MDKQIYNAVLVGYGRVEVYKVYMFVYFMTGWDEQMW